MAASLYALLQNMRPRQWSKNAFVFAGIVFDQKLLDLEPLGRVLAAFGLLCLMASSIYLINDLVDLEKDRQHPTKKNRPLASGRLPVRLALFAALLLPTTALGLSLLVSPGLTMVLVAYFILHVAYSFWLKDIVIMDVFAIAGGFVLRLVAGVVVINVEQFSPWLYIVMGLLSLFLAIGKRRQELVTLGEKATTTRTIFRYYNLTMLNDMLKMTMTSTAIAYSLYAIEAETVLATRPELMLLTVPFIYYGLFRYLYVIDVKGHGGDPTELLFEDRHLQAVIAAWGALIVVLLYGL
jgi:4-hydroxybenzoate polyprenyltransferase